MVHSHHGILLGHKYEILSLITEMELIEIMVRAISQAQKKQMAYNLTYVYSLKVT